MPRRGKRKQKAADAALTDDQLLDMAIAQAQQERDRLEVKERKREAARGNAESQDDRDKRLQEADDANVPHMSFMDLPEHPEDISKSQHCDSFHRILQKPAGGANDRQGTTRERAIYARKLRKWKRNGCRGTPPQKPGAESGGKVTKEEYFSNPVLVQGHQMTYARWLMKNLKAVPEGNARGKYTFNVIGDPKLRCDTLVVGLVKQGGCVYACVFEDGDIPSPQVHIGTECLLEVLPGNSAPRLPVGNIGSDEFQDRTSHLFSNGIPSGLVTGEREFSKGDLVL